MTTQNSQSPTEAALVKFRSALDDIAVDCSPAEAADALLSLALSVAERCTPPKELSAALIGLAAGYIATERPAGANDGSLTCVGHTALTAAIATMQASGLDYQTSRLVMLNFVGGWFSKDDPAGGAELLYKLADTLVGRSSKIN